MEVLCLTDLYNTIGQYEQAVDAIRKGCRWLQGRGAQKFWDVVEDDREFDLVDEAGAGMQEREGDVRPGFYPLDVNARHRLAIARIKMGDVEEGKVIIVFFTCSICLLIDFIFRCTRTLYYLMISSITRPYSLKLLMRILTGKCTLKRARFMKS